MVPTNPIASPPPTAAEWLRDAEPEITSVPTLYDQRYESLGFGGYIRRPCPHDE